MVIIQKMLQHKCCILLFVLITILFIITYKLAHDDYPKVAQDVAKGVAIVKVINYEKNHAEEFLGTGFVVSKDGYVLTAKHNYEKLADLNSITMEELISTYGYVRLYQDAENYKVLYVQNELLERKDILLLKISNPPTPLLHPVTIAKKEEVSPTGMEIGFTGYTKYTRSIHSTDLFMSKGILSNKINIKGATEPFYTVNTFATFGYSGSPVFLTTNGHVIGLLEQGELMKDFGQVGIILVPPIHEVPEILENISKTNDINTSANPHS